MPYIFILFIFFINCKPKPKNIPEQLELKQTGELSFRRSYSEIQFRELTKKEEDALNDAAPNCMECDSTLLTEFSQYDFIKDNKLILEKFKKDTLGTIILKAQNKPDVKLIYFFDTIKYEWKLKYNNNISKVSYLSYDSDPKMKLLQKSKFEYPQLIILYEYYIVNGHNYYLKIFELK